MGKLRLAVNIIGIGVALFLALAGFMGTLQSWMGGVGFLLVAIYGAMSLWIVKVLVKKADQCKDMDVTITTILEDIQTGDTDKYLGE